MTNLAPENNIPSGKTGRGLIFSGKKLSKPLIGPFLVGCAVLNRPLFHSELVFGESIGYNSSRFSLGSVTKVRNRSNKQNLNHHEPSLAGEANVLFIGLVRFFKRMDYGEKRQSQNNI